jgi:hypothetical protein
MGIPANFDRSSAANKLRSQAILTRFARKIFQARVRDDIQVKTRKKTEEDGTGGINGKRKGTKPDAVCSVLFHLFRLHLLLFSQSGFD